MTDDLVKETSPEVVDETVRGFFGRPKEWRLAAQCIHDSARRLSTALS